MRLGDIKIGCRITASFLVGSAFAAALQLYTLYNIDLVAGSTDSMFRHPLTVTQNLLEARLRLAEMRTLMGSAVEARSAEQAQRIVGQIAVQRIGAAVQADSERQMERRRFSKAVPVSCYPRSWAAKPVQLANLGSIRAAELLVRTRRIL